MINAAEDDVFADFCREIRVENIREFEARQLKLAQAESEARLQFDTQIARLTHAYAVSIVVGFTRARAYRFDVVDCNSRRNSWK